MRINLKRIYEAYSENDGYRILVDRLWPRGLSKESIKINLWEKDLAPSTQLRKWFNHDVAKWDEFRKRYREELLANPELAEFKKNIEAETQITLLFGAKDVEHNNAVVLKEVLEQ